MALRFSRSLIIAGLLIGPNTLGAISQSLSLQGTPFLPKNAQVTWRATNALPSQVAIYRLLPNPFPPGAIQRLLAATGLTDSNKCRQDKDWLVFETPSKDKRLGILFPLGSIEYQAHQKRSSKNLISGVPSAEDAIKQTTALMADLGIKSSDIEKDQSGNPNLHTFESTTLYFKDHTTITNTEFRGVRFRRSIAGNLFVGAGVGGNCELRFGDHGRLIKLSVSWRKVEKLADFPAAPPNILSERIRSGSATQGPQLVGAEPIQWNSVAQITISSARLCYAAASASNKDDLLVPFAALWASASTKSKTVDLEVDCPIVLESPR